MITSAELMFRTRSFNKYTHLLLPLGSLLYKAQQLIGKLVQDEIEE